MFSLRSQDRASLCSFTFADGGHRRTPRFAVHAQLCYFHSRKQAEAQAGRDFDPQWASLKSKPGKEDTQCPVRPR